MRTSITAEEVTELEQWVGAAAVFRLSGTKLLPEIVAWWVSGYSTPEPEETIRLAFALEVLKAVAAAEDSKETAVRWFYGSNVGSDEVSPFEAIQADQFEEVRRSAQDIIDDSPYSAL